MIGWVCQGDARFTARPRVNATAAAATPTVEKGTFLVEVEGVQRTTWETNWADEGGCHTSMQGSGAETVRFRSKPTRIRATWIGPTRLFFRGRALATLDLQATIKRSGTQQPGGETCSGRSSVPGRPISWPTLFEAHPATGKEVGAQLPIADLFRLSKNIVIAATS